MNSLLQYTKKFFIVIFRIFKFSIISITYILKGLKIIFSFVKEGIKTLNKRFKKLLRFSLTFKISFFYGLILSLMLLLSSTAILIGFRFLLINSSMENIHRDIERIEKYVIRENLYPIEAEIENSSKEYNITIFNDKKEGLYYKDESEEFLEPSKYSYIRNLTATTRISINKRVASDDKAFYIQISQNLSKENLYTKILVGILICVNGIITIISLSVGSKMSKKILQPIESMTSTVKAININNLNARLDVHGSQDELRELAETFNDMFDDIQSSYEKQNRFVSDASHELRTPIAVIQGYINLLDRWGKYDKNILQESIDAIKDESEAMKDLIEKLLFLARADNSKHNLIKEEFFMDELLEEIVRETKLIDNKHRISYSSNKFSYFGNRKSIKQAIRIFIDNSIKFTPEGGEIKLNAFTSGNRAIIEIQDSGIGIPKEDIPHIFDRFYRSDTSRTKATGGHGLGLSIAKWIIDNHQGNIKVESKINIGTKITIILPIIKENK